MFAKPKIQAVLIALVCICVVPMADSALAISVEVAKKCNELTAKAFPPRAIGNPASGSAKGSGKEERAYYRKCVANGGRVDEPSE